MMIWAVGRNYKDHVKEMNSPTPKEPLIFLKAEACLSFSDKFTLPSFSQDIHHELEVAVQLGEQNQPKQVALAIDLTARDLQAEAKAKGLPWALAKSFKQSCPISPWVPFKNLEWFSSVEFELKVNGQVRQQGRTRDMIFSLPKIIEFLELHFPLTPGDIILTGTPEGVSALHSGDLLQAKWQGVLDWDLSVG